MRLGRAGDDHRGRGGRVAALLTDGTDSRRIECAQQRSAPPRLEGNLDGPLRFQRRPPNDPARAPLPGDFTPRAVGCPRVVDGGDPDPQFDDRHGSRNDIGFTGGPFAAP